MFESRLVLICLSVKRILLILSVFDTRLPADLRTEVALDVKITLKPNQ